MFRRILAAGLLTVLTVLGAAGPVRADHDTAYTVAQMTAHYRDPSPAPRNRPFALLYLRTTEAMRDATAAGEFSDPAFWDAEVVPAFAAYHLDAYAAWRRGAGHAVAPAWRIAFRPGPAGLTCSQMLFLGMNAHVNNDLAFIIEEMGPRYRYADHRHVDQVLAVRARPAVYPEIRRDLCPDLFVETIPAGADADVTAWRELAWRNARRLADAPGRHARDAVAREIRRHAAAQAREILRW